MKCKIPEISWHNRDPVLSVDIQGKTISPNTYRLASGGTDAHVLVWHLSFTADGTDVNLDLAADLTRHQRAVNVVRWSPNGELLASGDDESVIFIWKQKSACEPQNIVDSIGEQDREIWIVLKILRGHMEDIYDLSWAPNSQFLVSGSVDNTAMIWEVYKGKSVAILKDHKGFVQGVAWDPKNQYIATLSTDRYMRIFDTHTKKVLHRVDKGVLPVPEGHKLHGLRMRYFHDDTLQTFFRRLCFTPDGKLLLTPSGVIDYEGATRPLHTTYAFSRCALRQPAIMLPCDDQYAIAVRCCPMLYRLRPHNPTVNPPVVPLPYRMIFVVATRSSVYFYDTQQRQPFAAISNIHYTRLTDATWSSDGLMVVVSSTDGFCSLITFEAGELGEEYENSELVFATLTKNVCPATAKKSKKPKAKSRTPSTKPFLVPDNVAPKAVQTNAKQSEQLCFDDVKNNNKTGEDVTEIAATLLTNTNTAASKIKLPLPKDIILDKEILSSDERFESPEKKSRDATPIMVRRYPRTASNSGATSASTAIKNTPPSNLADALKQITPASSTSVSAQKEQDQKQQPVCDNCPRYKQHATPIAVRRTPRMLIPATERSASNVSEPILPVEEALDAWPLPLENDDEPTNTQPKQSAPLGNSESTPTVKLADIVCEKTEDIHLVYEDTVDEDKQTPTRDAESEQTVAAAAVSQTTEVVKSSAVESAVTAPLNGATTTIAATVDTPKQRTQTPNKKTPRRVEFRTISTPKSKKKPLD